MNKAQADIHIDRGANLYSTGDLEGAISEFKKAVKANPANVDGYYNLGVAYQIQGDLKAALNTFDQSLKLNPKDFETHFNLGTLYLSLEDYQKAEKAFNQSLQLNPNQINALLNLGVTLQYQNRIDEAIELFYKATLMDPENISANNNLGVALSKKGQLFKSVPYFKKALENNPNYANAQNNLGSVYQQLGRLDDAEDYYKQAIKNNPQYVEALLNLATTYQDQRKFIKAIDNFNEVLALDPQNSYILAHLADLLRLTCDWPKLKEIEHRLQVQVDAALKIGKKSGEDPFLSISRVDDPGFNLRVAKLWFKDIEAAADSSPVRFTFSNRKPKSLLKIGYVNNFEDMPVASLITDLFKLHNKKKFQVSAYHFGRSNNPFHTNQVKKYSDKFVDITTLDHPASAQKINSDQIDILIDLKGFTKANRVEIFSYRPAPIQVSYLGFPGTTGANFFDYLIVDHTLVPPQFSKYYQEKLVFMPDCYQINTPPQFTPQQVTKKELELPGTKFTFASFNRSSRINQALFVTWMRILGRVPNSVLWIFADNEVAEKNLSDFTLQSGINPKRLIFFRQLPFDKFMSAVKYADLALDTQTYNGGATTSQLLWSGVPIITILGNHYVSRMGASLLTAIGLPELITHSLKEYEDLAVRLATHPDELEIRNSKLKINKKSYPLFDTPHFVRNLEKEFLEMWENYLGKK